METRYRYSSWKKKTTLALMILAACSSDATEPVALPSLYSVSVSLSTSTLAVGQSTQAFAILQDSIGRSIAESGATVHWSSSNPTVASVSPKTGTVTALSAGTTSISASAKGKVASADLVVTGPQGSGTVRSIGVSLAPTLNVGRSMQATATPKDAAGNLLVGRTVAWSTSDANVAAVSTNGTVTGSGVGTATISATSEGTTGTASVTVLSRSLVSSLGLSLNVPAIQIGGVAQGTVTARDSVGDVVSGLPTTWVTSDASIASVSPTGAITGNAPGTVTISATVEGKTATATLRVASLSVASVTVVVAPDLAVGASTAATTILRDRDGNALNDRIVTWTVSNPVIANISTTAGVLTGLTAGYVIVTATSEDQTGNALVHVGATGTVGGGGATLLGLVTQPSSSVQSGAVFGSQPSVQIRDGSNNPFSQSGVVVVAAIASGSGSLSGTTTATTDASGLATFTNLKITGPVGARTLSFSATALAPAISGTINVIAGAATQITVSSQPSASAQSGVAFGAQPAAQIRDVSGNAAGQAGVVVTASIATGTGTLGGTTTATTNASGVAAFTNLSITGTGANTLRFAATGLTSVTSSTISLGAGAPAILTITTQPSSSSASGASFAQQPAVRLRDASNNAVSQSGVVVTATMATGGGTLGGTTTATTSSSGVATFTNLSITGAAGARTLSFDAASLTGATSGTITLTAGAAAQLAVATQPSSAAQSGTAFSAQPAIRLRDASGNSVSQSGVVVTASIATGTGTLAGTLTATTNASGVATFTNLGITGSGAYTLQFVAAGLAAITSGTINVSAAAVATQVAIATQPSSSALSGAAFSQQPVVRLQGVSGNSVSQSGVSITAAIASGSGTLGGTATATTNASGVATFTDLSITGTAGSRTISFTAASLAGVTSNAVLVTGVASQIAINDGNNQSAVRASPVATAPSVVVKDQFGNPVSGVSVTFAVTGGGGSISGANQTTGANGVARVGSWTLGSTSGTNTLAATSTGLSGSPVAFTATGTAPPATSTYFNSSEPGCDGSNANVLWCDDFERGSWFKTTADVNNAANAGWNGTPFGSADPQGLNFGRCSGAGVGGSCAVTQGGHTGGIGQARGMADHSLSASVTEVYFRYYVKPLSGYQFGQEKSITFNKGAAGVGGIYAGTVFYGLSETGTNPAPKPTFLSPAQGVNLTQNQGNNYSIVTGHWNFVQVRIKYVAPGSDILQMWMDDCGTDGRACTGSPTLRMSYTNATLRPAGDNSPSIGSIWIENWANPPALGEMYYDQIKAAKTPIGFMP